MEDGKTRLVSEPDGFLWNDLDWVKSMRLREQAQEILPVLRRTGIGLHGTTQNNLPSILEHGLDSNRTGRRKPEIYYYVYRPQRDNYDDNVLVTRLLGSVRGTVIWAIQHSNFERDFWLWRDDEEKRELLEGEMPTVVIFHPPSTCSLSDDSLPKITFPIENPNAVIRPEFTTQITTQDLGRLVEEVGEGFDNLQERLAGEFAERVVRGLATKWL